jgi:prepilin signal peptidase PulO-like enzyme (type II secretory pathway)
MLSIFIGFGLISNFINGYGLFYNLFQGAFMSFFVGGCLYLYFKHINRKSQSGQDLPLKAKVAWRVLFWSGIFVLIFGTGLITAYINNVLQSQIFQVLGFAVIIFGIVLMATGYLVSQGKLIN